MVNGRPYPGAISGNRCMGYLQIAGIVLRYRARGPAGLQRPRAPAHIQQHRQSEAFTEQGGERRMPLLQVWRQSVSRPVIGARSWSFAGLEALLIALLLLAAGILDSEPAAALPSQFTDSRVVAVASPTDIAFTPTRPVARHDPGRRALPLLRDLPVHVARPLRGRLLGLRTRSPRRRDGPRLRRQPLRLRLLHVQQERHLLPQRLDRPGQPRLAFCVRRQLRGPRLGSRPDRQHAVAQRQPQRRRPRLRQGRLPLRDDRRRRLRPRRPKPLWQSERQRP